MKISKVLVISKRSALERVVRRRKLAAGDPVLKNLRDTARDHVETLAHVRSVLAKRAVDADLIKRTGLEKLKSPCSEYDLIIAVGGDGTLLNASHYIMNTPLLGVLSSQKGSIGVLCGSNRFDFEEVLDGIVAGRVKPVELQRLRVKINGKVIEIPALNDVLFAHQFPASTARYILTYRKRSEEQKSSGLWIATAAGSTAAAMTAGGKALPIGSRKFVFTVREPFFDKKGRHILRGVLGPKEKLVIKSTTIGGAVFIDGQPPAYPVGFNQAVAVGLHPRPIKIFGYNSSRRQSIIKARS